MTARQKVAQMIQAEISSIRPEDLAQIPVGAILNGGGCAPGNNKRVALSEWLGVADAFFEASIAGGGVPIMWGTDAVHGHSNVCGATVFPHNIGLGAARNPQLIDAIGAATAAEIVASGMDWTFAPTLAVARDDRWGRTYESYSENPEIVKEYAPRLIRGLQGKPAPGALGARGRSWPRPSTLSARGAPRKASIRAAPDAAKSNCATSTLRVTWPPLPPACRS